MEKRLGPLVCKAETWAQHGSTATARPGLSQFMQPGSSDLNGALLALAAFFAIDASQDGPLETRRHGVAEIFKHGRQAKTI